MEIIHVNTLREIPHKFTGIVHEYYGDYQNLFCIMYYKEGLLHRRDGPAIRYDIGNETKYIIDKKKWYYEGERISPEDLFEKLSDEEKEKAIWNMNDWK